MKKEDEIKRVTDESSAVLGQACQRPDRIRQSDQTVEAMIKPIKERERQTAMRIELKWHVERLT